MTKYSFKNDYSEGIHPNILSSIESYNLDQEPGYGEDRFTKSAIKQIESLIRNPASEIHLISGGTITNVVVISSFLRPHQAVIAASTGHIATHETGAIEATGHKVITVDSPNGKLTPELIYPVLKLHSDEHMVQPAMVYISNTTEVGSVYSLEEIEELYEFCQMHHLLFYLDGARLSSAIAANQGKLTLHHLAQLTDAFYIGGTKNGLLLGEALIINNPNFQKDFRYNLKQKGALMAKGRILGIQFHELFSENLFFQLGEYANATALLIASKINAMGYTFLAPPESNQIFPILPNKVIAKLSDLYDFYIWEKIDNEHSAIRIVTSWATPFDKVKWFCKDLEKIKSMQSKKKTKA